MWCLLNLQISDLFIFSFYFYAWLKLIDYGKYLYLWEFTSTQYIIITAAWTFIKQLPFMSHLISKNAPLTLQLMLTVAKKRPLLEITKCAGLKSLNKILTLRLWIFALIAYKSLLLRSQECFPGIKKEVNS